MLKSSLPISKSLRFSFASFQPKPRGVMQSIHQKDEEPTFLQMVKNYFDQAGRYTNIPKDVLEVYKNCNRVIKLNLPLVRENGKIEYITSYRAQHKHHKYFKNFHYFNSLIDCQRKEEQEYLLMSICKKLKPCLV